MEVTTKEKQMRTEHDTLPLRIGLFSVHPLSLVLCMVNQVDSEYPRVTRQY